MTPRKARDLAFLEQSTRGGSAGAEMVVLDWARREAQAELGRAGRRGGRLARWSGRAADRAAALRERAVAVVDRVAAGPAGAEDAAILRERHDRDAAQVDRSLAAGETVHRRAGRAARILARVVPWLDALLFAYFIAGVSNADVVRPWTTPVASLVALAFTALLVLTVAVFTPWLGHRLRVHKGPHGEPAWEDLDGSLRGLLGLWTLLTSATGVTMFVRVEAEAALSGAEPWTGTTVAVLLALGAVVLSTFVLLVAYADGSDLADDVRCRARRLVRAERRAARLRARALRLDRRRNRLAGRVRLHEARATARAGERLRRGERTVELVRLRTGVPVDVPAPRAVPVEELDQRELRVVRGLL